MKNNRQIMTILAAICAVLVIAAGVFVFLRARDAQTVSRQDSDDFTYEDSEGKSENSLSGTEITVDGKTYIYNTDIRNILFMGVDKKDETMEVQEYAGRGGTGGLYYTLVFKYKRKNGCDVEYIQRFYDGRGYLRYVRQFCGNRRNAACAAVRLW